VSLKLRAKDTALVVIDVQQRLVPAMPAAQYEALTRNVVTLVAAASQLNIPVCVSEQYPTGLGRTVPVVVEAVSRLQPSALFLDKTMFSIAGEPLFQRFLDSGRKQLVIVGMETHICVFQSVRDLVARGYDVHVPRDAVISRTPDNHATGMALIAASGAVATSTETVIFDLLERAGTESFKILSRLVK
jgi:nicotinamidase-related amidase